MPKKFLIVKDRLVHNSLIFDDTAQIQDNTITVQGQPPFPAPEGSTFFEHVGAAGIGWTVDGSTFVAPVRVDPTWTKDQLFEYANRFQWNLACGGHNVTINGTPYLFPTDDVSVSLMTGKVVRLQLASAPTSVDWQLPSGFVTIASADFIVAAANIADWMQSTFEALKPVLAAIDAGTITTPVQVIAASWPSP